MNPFFSDVPSKSHLLRGSGLGGEIRDLRNDVEAAFDRVFTSSSASGGILWAPDESGHASTFEEVMAYVEASKSPFPIYVRGTSQNSPYLDIPGNDEPYDFKGCWFEQRDLSRDAMDVVRFQQGAMLKNLSRAVGGLVLESVSDAPVLSWDASGNQYFFSAELSAALKNSGTAPMIAVDTMKYFVFLMSDFVSIRNSQSVQVQEPVIDLDSGAACVLAINGTTADISDKFVRGDNTNSLFWFHDGSVSFSQQYYLSDESQFNCPRSTLGGAGPSTFRPSSGPFGNLKDLTSYNDTTIRKMVLWDAGNSEFVDALGDALV